MFQFGDPSLELVAHFSAERDESWSCIDKLPTFRLGKQRTLGSGLAVAVDAEKGLQLGSTLDQGTFAQVLAIEVEKVEGVED